jgi:hypothetical protein
MPDYKGSRRLTLLGFIVFAAVTPAQQPQDHAEPGRTFGEWNGRVWRGMPKDVKLGYMEGVEAGLAAAFMQEINTPCESQGKGILQAHSAINFTQAEVIDAVDHFYDQPENLLIRITDALEIVAAKTRGVPHDVIETKISERRRAANEAPERK